MIDPDRPDEEATSHDLPAGGKGPTGWTRGGVIGAVLLVGVMIAAGVFAAIMVTPQPDTEALARPAGSDLVVSGGAPLAWDPATISDAVSAQLLSQVYEGLTVLDAGDQVRPALASSWAVDDDGEGMAFTLRDGLTFSDGSPLVAADVRRSWLRVIDPDRPSPLSSLLDDVAGAAAYSRGEVSADEVGISADGSTVRVEFERPAAYFPAVAAVPTLAVVPASIDDLLRGPVRDAGFPASGPYVPLDQDLGVIRLQANEHYWGGQPAIENITVLTDDGGRSNIDVFEDEAVDWTPISEADAAWIRYDRSLGPQLRHTPEMSVDFLAFDTSQPPFDDVAARRAVAMAVDWRRLAGLQAGASEGPTSIVPPGTTGRSDGDYVLPYDPEAARAELATAGYPDGVGFPVVALATYGAGPSAAIAADLERELGISVDVEHRPFAEHSRLLDSDPPSMWTLAWSADYPHAHDFLGLLLRSGSSANVGQWSDGEFDSLIEAAAATADPDEQTRLYDQAQQIVREDVPLIPVGYGDSWALSREGLAGATVSGVGLLRYGGLEWTR